jgi:hypothetical protein
MALIDRSIGQADNFVIHAGTLKDYASGSSVTSTGVQVDPMVSGANFAHLFNGTAGSKTITMTTKDVSLYESFCLEIYLYMDGSSLFTGVKLGADTLIEHISTGLARVTLPYATGTTQTLVKYTPDDITQFSINMSTGAWSVFVDGVQETYGAAPSGGIKSLSNVSMTSPASGTLVFGAMALFPVSQDERFIQARMMEAIFGTPDHATAYDMTVYSFSDNSQNFSVKFDIPKFYPWSDYLSDGLKAEGGRMGLDLYKVESYDSVSNYYYTSRANVAWGTNQGRAHVNIPSFSATGTNRGIIHMKSTEVGSDQFALRFNTSNRLELLRTVWSRDAGGNDTSSITTTLMSQPASGITGGAAVSVGFGWNYSGLYVVYGTTATLVAGTEGINFNNYEVYFGNIASTVNGAFDQPYYTAQSQWTWELRLWNSFDHTAPTVSTSSYGNHTFYTSEYASEMPVRAEATLIVDVPLMSDDTIRRPYLYIDGNPSSVSETLV